MTDKDLKAVLDKHRLWLDVKPGGERADLSGADLAWSNLTGANLSGANLSRADLSGADLAWADLAGADLTGTIIDPSSPVPTVTDEEITAAGLEIRGDQVWGWRTDTSQHCGNTEYKHGQCYEAPWFSVDTKTDCHPGIYLAGKSWLDEHYPRRPPVRCYCLRSELVHAGDKWRAKRLWIVED